MLRNLQCTWILMICHQMQRYCYKSASQCLVFWHSNSISPCLTLLLNGIGKYRRLNLGSWDSCQIPRIPWWIWKWTNYRHFLVLTLKCILVLPTVPGYPAAVRVWNRTGWSSPGCYPENRGTHRVRGRVRTRPRFHFTVPPTLAPIKYLSSDRIMTWSVRKLCSISRSFISRFQICDPIDIRWVAVK